MAWGFYPSLLLLQCVRRSLVISALAVFQIKAAILNHYLESVDAIDRVEDCYYFQL